MAGLLAYGGIYRILFSSVAVFAIINIFRCLVGKHITRKAKYMLWLMLLLQMLLSFAPPLKIRAGKSFTEFQLLISNLWPKIFERFSIISNRCFQKLGAAGMPAIWFQGLLFIWLSGMVILLIISARRLYKQYKILYCNRTFLEKNGQIKVYSVPKDNVACVILNEAYIGKNICTNQQVYNAIIEHEKGHRNLRDTLWNIFRIISKAVFWFNPFVWIAIRASKYDAEEYCDEAVVLGKDFSYRKWYADILLDLSSKTSTSDAVNCISGKGKQLERRICSVINDKKKSIPLSVCALVLCSALCLPFTITVSAEARDIENLPQSSCRIESLTVTDHEIQVEICNPDTAMHRLHAYKILKLTENGWEECIHQYCGTSLYERYPDYSIDHMLLIPMRQSIEPGMYKAVIAEYNANGRIELKTIETIFEVRE